MRCSSGLLALASLVTKFAAPRSTFVTSSSLARGIAFYAPARVFATTVFEPGNQYQLHRPTTSPAQRTSAPLDQGSVRYCSHRNKAMCQYREGSAAQVPNREVLPTNVKPVHYDLTLEPDFEKFTYDGEVIIDLEVKEDTTSVVLNTIDITIHSAEIEGAKGVVSTPPKMSSNEDDQTTTFSIQEALPSGSQAKLSLKFTGTLNDHLAGFYRSTYKDKDGNKKWMATTQMEPTDARRAFPCFDEPALKAKFTVTLVADKGLTCLGNMDVKEEKEVESKMSGTKKQAVTFNTTPLMSTYLLAFIVGEFNMIETNDFRVPVRVYAPPDQDIEHGRFSLDLAARTLAFYEEKFGEKFPLPKMDMIAIPDFSAGAMENWGLITYRVVDLLYNEKTSGAATKQRVAEVVAHELAHQWFGNLVTMDFWEGLWLNEGFATWVSWFACNNFYPEWKVWESYVTDTLQGALSLDSLRSSHPIEVPIKRADEINQIFDAISYMKGSCVLRMISKYVGEENFLEGVRQYLKKHAYGNTQTTDLWAALSESSGKDVEKAMTIWTKAVGYPVITVTEDEKSNSIHVKQNRFLRTADVTPEDDKTLFPVFLGLRTKDGVDEELALFDREHTFNLSSLDFYKINADHSGIYRTFYPSSRLAKLGEAAKTGLLSVEDRAGMVADAGALASSGYQKSSGTLTLLQGFADETEFVVWSEITSFIGSLRSAWIFEEEETKQALKTVQRNLSSAKAHSLGWEFKEEDGAVLQQFKAMMFGTAGSAGDEKIIAAAQDMFKKYIGGDRAAIHPNIRGSVFGIVLANGGEKEYDAILDEYHTAKQSDERNTALSSLGRAKDAKLIKRSIDLALSDDVRNQDIYYPLMGLRTHKEGIEALFEMLTTKWEELSKRLPASLGMLGSVVGICTGSFTHQDQADKVEAFFKDKSTKGFDQVLAQKLDGIKAKTNWIGRDKEDVAEWLKKEGY